MIHPPKVVIYVMCIVMGSFSIGCYSVNTVRLSESQTIAGEDLFTETKVDGRSVEYHKGDLDSLHISGTTAARYSQGRTVSSTPLDSVRSIQTKTFNWSRTIGAIVMSAAASSVVAFLIMASQLKDL